ncbi:MAG: hypothetical protein H7Y01_01165 [Ferruginibacter sp.]|nr:hypothetical protein [Chitinophagaceae bacterium]
MKKIISLVLVVMAISVNGMTTGITTPSLPPAEPSATFDSIWVDYNVTEGGLKGMKIHLSFSAYSMKDMDAYVAIYFEYNDDMAGFLKDKNKKFNSTEGDVAVYQSIKPAYDPAVYKDLQLFMPYTELDLEAGIYDLTMDAKLIHKKGGIIQWLTYYDFEYTRPGSPADVESKAKAGADFENLWIDYDVTENGKKGMRIHVKFTALNLKDVDCYLAVYFEKKNGEKIDGISTNYRSKNGQLAVYKSIKPAYAETVYKDLQLFMPYTEIKLPRGKFDLKLEADIILKNGDMIKHLKDHEFWFEQ